MQADTDKSCMLAFERAGKPRPPNETAAIRRHLDPEGIFSLFGALDGELGFFVQDEVGTLGIFLGVP